MCRINFFPNLFNRCIPKYVYIFQDDLLNLKDFSLTGYVETNAYDNEVITLIRRMTQLEKLTLYIRVYRLARFTDGNHLHNYSNITDMQL